MEPFMAVMVISKGCPRASVQMKCPGATYGIFIGGKDEEDEEDERPDEDGDEDEEDEEEEEEKEEESGKEGEDMSSQSHGEGIHRNESLVTVVRSVSLSPVPRTFNLKVSVQ